MRVFLGFVTFFRFTLHWVNHRNNELRAMARELLTGEDVGLLCVCNEGNRVSLDGVAARGLVNGRGPTRSVGRDGVGT